MNDHEGGVIRCQYRDADFIVSVIVVIIAVVVIPVPAVIVAIAVVVVSVSSIIVAVIPISIVVIITAAVIVATISRVVIRYRHAGRRRRAYVTHAINCRRQRDFYRLDSFLYLVIERYHFNCREIGKRRNERNAAERNIIGPWRGAAADGIIDSDRRQGESLPADREPSVIAWRFACAAVRSDH